MGRMEPLQQTSGDGGDVPRLVYGRKVCALRNHFPLQGPLSVPPWLRNTAFTAKIPSADKNLVVQSGSVGGRKVVAG